MTSTIIKSIDTADVAQLDELIKTAEYNYIYEDKQLYTDEEYDYMLQRYSFLTGKNRVSNTSISKDCTMTKLPVWMPSLSKALEGSNTIELWTKKGPVCNYVVSMKLDGCSALYSGSENKLYTRGTYSEGQDITMLLPYLCLPKTDMMIRGELIIPEKVFKEKYATSYTNARATVAGECRAFNISSYSPEKITEMHKEIAHDIKFVAYEIILMSEYQLKPERQLDELQLLDFITVKYKILPSVNNKLLSDVHTEFMVDSEYAFDGLVVWFNKKYIRCTSDRPKYSIAYKKELENLIGFSEVVSITWNVSKCGYIKPIINIKPITINSVLISKTTGINAKFIKNNVIGPGAKVKIIRSGDVIPNIAEVLSPATDGIPDMPGSIKYVWNDTMTDIIISEENEDVIIQQIKFFLKTLKIKGLDKKYIKRIYEMSPANNSILAFITLTKKDIEVLGDVLSTKIITNIKAGISNATPGELMTASGIFGRGLGIKRINEIFSAIPDIITKGRSYDPAILRQELHLISGFGDAMIDIFIESFQKYLDWHDLLIAVIPVGNSIEKLNHYLTNKVISITGTRNPEILAFLDKIGAHVKPLSSKTHILIVKNYELKNNKTVLVEDKGFKCKIISVPDFIKEWISL